MPALAGLGIGRLMIGKAAEYVPHIALELHTIRTSPLISDSISPTVVPNAQCVPATAVGVKIIPVKTHFTVGQSATGSYTSWTNSYGTTDDSGAGITPRRNSDVCVPCSIRCRVCNGQSNTQ